MFSHKIDKDTELLILKKEHASDLFALTAIKTGRIYASGCPGLTTPDPLLTPRNL